MIKNVIENIVYIIIVGIMIIAGNYFTIKAQQDAFIEAINKNTTEIINTFEKIKSHKGQPINVNLNSEATTNINDTIPKVSTFGKLKFWK